MEHLFLDAQALGNVVNHRQATDNFSTGVDVRRAEPLARDALAVTLAIVQDGVAVAIVAVDDGVPELRCLVPHLGGNQEVVDVPFQGLARGISEDALRRRVPDGYAELQVPGDIADRKST